MQTNPLQTPSDGEPRPAFPWRWFAMFWAVMAVYAIVRWIIGGWSSSTGRGLVIAASSLLMCLASADVGSRKGTLYLIGSIVTLLSGFVVIEFVLA